MIGRTHTQSEPLMLARWLPIGLVALALLSGWWSVGRGVRYAITALRYVAPLDGQEGMALWEAGLLRAGRGLYLPVVPEYFVSAPYPPVHPVLLALFGFAAGPHMFWAGRIISLVAGVCVGVCGCALVRRGTGSIVAGIAAAVLVWSFAPLQLWSLRIKPDMVGLGLTVAGLWLVARWQPIQSSYDRSDRSHWLGLSPTLIGAAVVFVAAHFAKQTLLAGPLAAATYLVLRNWRVAIRWGVLYLGLLAAVWLALDLVTHGQYTYHVWVLHKLEWSGARFAKLSAQLRDAWPLIILSVLGLAATLRRPTVINAYVLWAPASLIGAGVIGSHHNHLLETGVALSLAGAQAIGLAVTGRITLDRGALRVLAPVLLLTQLLIWQQPLDWFAGEFEPEENYERYIDFIRATPGEVMANDVSLMYAAGRPLIYDDPAAMGPAASLGLWDQRQFVADIRDQRFSAILLDTNVFHEVVDASGRWTPDMLQAIKDAYTIKFKDTIIIYVPKDAPTS